MHLKKRKEINLYLLCSIVFRSDQNVDCEQSLFFLRFSKGSARAASVERRSRETRDARREKRGREPEKKKFECLSRLAASVTRVVICVSRALCSTEQEKRETARSLIRMRLLLSVLIRVIAAAWRFNQLDNSVLPRKALYWPYLVLREIL